MRTNTAPVDSLNFLQESTTILDTISVGEVISISITYGQITGIVLEKTKNGMFLLNMNMKRLFISNISIIEILYKDFLPVEAMEVFEEYREMIVKLTENLDEEIEFIDIRVALPVEAELLEEKLISLCKNSSMSINDIAEYTINFISNNIILHPDEAIYFEKNIKQEGKLSFLNMIYEKTVDTDCNDKKFPFLKKTKKNKSGRCEYSFSDTNFNSKEAISSYCELMAVCHQEILRAYRADGYFYVKNSEDSPSILIYQSNQSVLIPEIMFDSGINSFLKNIIKKKR